MNSLKSILFSFTIFIDILSGQENSFDSFDSLDLINKLSILRTEFLGDSNDLMAYGVVAIEDAKVNWDSINKVKFKIKYHYTDYTYYNDPINLNKILLNKIYGENSILTKLNIDVGEVKRQNRFLISSIEFGIIDSFYPFKLKITSDFFNELKFYEINSFDTLLDYDIGYLCFAPILCSIYPNIHFNLAFYNSSDQYLNDSELTNLLTLDKFSTIIQLIITNSNKLHGVNSHFDKIFIQIPLEYYYKPVKTLKEATSYLKKNGFLYFYQNKSPASKGLDQAKSYSPDKISNHLEKSGLKLIEKLELRTKTIYKCIKTDTSID